jgi:hypothetical protein
MSEAIDEVRKAYDLTRQLGISSLADRMKLLLTRLGRHID